MLSCRPIFLGLLEGINIRQPDKMKTIASKKENNTMTEKKCYTLKEVQDILRISRPTAYKLLKKREFKWVLIAKKYLIIKDSFDSWMQDRYGVSRP